MTKSRLFIAAALALLPGPALAEFDGPRIYWPLPKNSNAVSMTRFDGRANLQFDLTRQYRGNLDVAPDVWILGYTRNQPLLGRQILWQALLPFGSLDTDSSLPAGAANTFADGLGDLQLGATIGLIGAPELMVKDYLRWEEPFVLHLGILASFPTGTYDPNEALNLGSNRTNLRISAPMVIALSDWVPGQRTTLELMPAVRFFGENPDSLGESVEQDPLYSLEAHLTRDLTRESFFSLDYTYLQGGEQTLSGGGASPGIDAHFAGLTFGFKVNDNLSMNLSHMQSVAGDTGGFDINAAITKLQFVYAWHDVLERRRGF